jgi:8-oxo-dGTP diphosphatase
MSQPLYRPGVGVHLILHLEGQILLGLRANTGFADGWWSVPGGRLEGGEPLTTALVREGKEEIGVVIDEADLELAVVCHHNDVDEARIGMFFAADRWSGEVANAEPEKCAKLEWFASSDLPDQTVDYVRAAVAAWRGEQSLVIYGWQQPGYPTLLAASCSASS